MKLIKLLALASIMCLFSVSCKEDTGGSASLGIQLSLDDLTPLYKGTSSFMGNSKSDVVLYSTKIENLYYIHQFFGEDGGGLGFTWDRQTNKISLEESFTGLLGEGGPVFVLSQSKYLFYAGEDAIESFFSPATGVFSFYVVMETADATGQAVQFTTVLNFSIKSGL